MIPRKFRRKDSRDVPSSKKESYHSNPLVSANHTIQQQSYLKVASSLVSEGLTLATSQLQALYTSLPPSLQAYIDLASQTIHRNLPHQLQRYSRTLPDKTSSIPVNLDPTTIATAWILPLIALLFFMTRNYWHGGHSGGYSPATQYSGGTPRVTEGDYEYLDEGDYNPQNRYRNDRSDSYGFPRSRNASKAEPELDPDILIMKHKGTTYPLHFPAYDISEGRLSVGDLRKVAAKETGTRDPRCIKLLYKGKSLHNDHRACKEENLKQNSEILCVISSEPDRGGDDGNDSSSSASSDMIANGIDDMGRGARIDVDGTIINDREPKKRRNHRGGRQKKRRDPSPSRASPTSSSTSTFLQPPNATSTNGSSHSHTTSRQPSPPRPTQPTQQKKPTTPSEALDQISTNFHQTFIPQCQRFISHPPTDPKTREFEYKKLSEAILAQVILKLDEVETQGDEGVRARRKELVRETQGWLGSLDERGRR